MSRHHQYEEVPDVGDKKNAPPEYRGVQLVLVAVMCIGFGMLLNQSISSRGNGDVSTRAVLYSESGPLSGPGDEPTLPAASRYIIHISDIHVDPLFDPTQSMQTKVCHTCNMSNKVYGDKAWCPKHFLPDADAMLLHQQSGYAFGRYGCNPPHRLWLSLVQHLLSIQPHPKVIVLTGDIAPHGYPDDMYELEKHTTLEDLCDAKFNVIRHMVTDMVSRFPGTKWAFTMGNNDHFPKNVFWPPYIKRLGDMFLETGFFTSEQHAQFIMHGCNYIDIDNVRYLSIDFTVFTAGGEQPREAPKHHPEDAHSMYPIRHKITIWVNASLADAKEKGLNVWIVGHQPLSTKKGSDELAVDSTHYRLLKALLTQYEPIIRVGLFGHRNQAGLSEVLSPEFMPLFPSLTAPGVSPRGLNQPSFFLLEQAVLDGSVVNFEQHIFDLMNQNTYAKKATDISYLGTWHHHNGKLKSWQSLTGYDKLTEVNLRSFLDQLTTRQEDFFAIETWKKAGYIGEESPESYDCKTEYDMGDEMMNCLFPNQDKQCFDKGWLKA